MTLRPEYGLGHSPYNAFLFATAGFARAGRASSGTDGARDRDGGVDREDDARDGGDRAGGDRDGSDRDGGGEEVTVLSALTRLNADPWAEAARLANLPADAAAQALAATLMPLTDLEWVTGDLMETSRRLVALLPAGGVPDVPLLAASPAPHADAVPGGSAAAESRIAESKHEPASRPEPGRRSWLAWAILLFAMLAVALYLNPDNRFEPLERPADRQ